MRSSTVQTSPDPKSCWRSPCQLPRPAKSGSSRGVTDDQILSNHFIRAAPIAAVYIHCAGQIEAFDEVGFEAPPDSVVLCCVRGKQAGLAATAGREIAMLEALATKQAEVESREELNPPLALPSHPQRQGCARCKKSNRMRFGSTVCNR
jgi:hypothetical protein